MHACKSMQRTLLDAAAKGWAVLGAAGEAGAADSRTLRVDRPTILVVGECCAQPMPCVHETGKHDPSGLARPLDSCLASCVAWAHL